MAVLKLEMAFFPFCDIFLLELLDSVPAKVCHHEIIPK